MNFIIAFVVSLISVFAKGFQYKNVNGNHYKLVLITSWAMSTMDVIIVGLIVKESWLVIIPIGLGASIGMVSSMWIHNRYVKKEMK